MNKLLLIAALLFSAMTQAQTTNLQPDQLDYYLLQALNANAAQQRYALNHIGIQVLEEDRGYRITAVLEGYPAQQAGLYRGDLIVSAEGASFHPVFTFNMPAQAPDRFKANPRPVTLSVQRGASELQISVTPVFENLMDSYRSATLSSIQQFPSGNKTVAYLRLWVLSRNSSDLISYQRLFAELQGSDGLILDLRDSNGFLDRQQLDLVYRGAANPLPGLALESANSQSSLPTEGYRNPIALLINGHTRGGAELLASQLGALARVVTFGERTAGELGTWSQDEADDGLLYQPSDTDVNGTLFEGNGLEPETSQPYPFAQPGRVDPQFQTAMELLMGII